MRDRPSLSLYRGMASRASPPQKRTSGSDGLDGERNYKFNFEIKLRSVEEKEAFKRRLSKVRGLLTPPAPVNPSTIFARCTSFLTVYVNSVNLWSFAFLSYLLSIFRVLLYLDILRESHGLDGFVKFCEFSFQVP